MKIALLVMIASVLIQHLGLAEAVSKVFSKVASCSTCFTFWACLASLLYEGYDAVIAVVLSILCAYASNWLIIGLIYMQKCYDYIYNKENEQEGGGESAPNPDADNKDEAYT